MEKDIALVDEVQNSANDQGNPEGSTGYSIRKAEIQDSRPPGHRLSASVTARRDDTMNPIILVLGNARCRGVALPGTVTRY